jgi:hypothetical protein
VAVTKAARQRKIAFDCLPAVLAGNHLIHRKRQAGELLGQAAILARIRRTLADQMFKRMVHSTLRLPDYAF